MIKFTQLIILFMVGAILQGFGDAFGALQKLNANKESLFAQSQENEKIRKYNLQLAKLQNEWNIQQWERSNSYNNPLNQMNRLKASGLNPNLVYANGAGQSVAAPNPQLSSGAAATPADMSLMSQRPTVGDIINQSLQNRAIQAQIEKTEADVRKTNADAGISETDLKYRDALNALGVDEKSHTVNILSQQSAAAVKEYEKLKYEVEQSKVVLRNLKLDEFQKKINNAFREKEIEQLLIKLKNEAKISEQEARYAVESYASRLLLTDSNAAIAADNAAIPAFLENIKDKNQLGSIGATLFQAVRYLLGFINPLL